MISICYENSFTIKRVFFLNIFSQEQCFFRLFQGCEVDPINMPIFEENGPNPSGRPGSAGNQQSINSYSSNYLKWYCAKDFQSQSRSSTCFSLNIWEYCTNGCVLGIFTIDSYFTFSEQFRHLFSLSFR